MKSAAGLMACLCLFQLTGCNSGKVERRSAHSKKKATAFSNLEFARGEASSGQASIASPVAYIEFNAKGNLMDPGQIVDAETLIQSESRKPGKLLVITYVHGWTHGSKSADVAKFKNFLGHLGQISHSRGLRVMGVYLVWPGAAFGPLKIVPDGDCQDAEKVVNAHWWSPLAGKVETLSIWRRWEVACNVGKNRGASSLSAMANRLFTTTKDAHAVSLHIGHSMCGLITEAAVVDRVARKEYSGPDLTFIMNSAAPAMYAKWARDNFGPASPTTAPRIFSITSTADTATKVDAPKALHIKGYPFPRDYGPVKKEYAESCPGHTLDLVSHKVVGKPVRPNLPGGIKKGGWILAPNLWPNEKRGRMQVMAVNPPTAEASALIPNRVSIWQIRVLQSGRGNYPIVQVPPELIADHRDIWDSQAASILAAAVRISRILEEVN